MVMKMRKRSFVFIFWLSLPALHSVPHYSKGGNGDDYGCDDDYDCDDDMAMMDDG